MIIDTKCLLAFVNLHLNRFIYTIFLSPGYPKTLDEFTYEDWKINEFVYKCIGNLAFRGVARDYLFNDNGDIEDSVTVDRIQSMK